MASSLRANLVQRSLVYLGLATALLANPCQAMTKPNVVLILTDDQGYGDLGCHGNPTVKTPRLDALHGESLRLTNFHATPMCTPTRGQLMTGRLALTNGAMNVSSGRTMLRTEIPTMAEIFAASGYQTGQFGKWHLGDVYPYRPQDRGFHESVFFPSSHVGSAADAWNNDYFDDIYQHNGKKERFKGYCTDVFFNQAMDWIKTCQAREQPFFAYIATNAAHGPYFVPDRYRAPYKQLPHRLATFFGMIANLDENVGRLEDMLEASGLKRDTIFIFMTDNGGTAGVTHYNAGMRGKKVDLYDGGHRVPCFVRWPNGKLAPTGDVHALTACQDLLPTLIDLCSLQTPPECSFDGISLAKLLQGKVDQLPERSVIIQFSRMNHPAPTQGDAAVLRDRWRLIGGTELYDIQADPAQKTNLADKHPDLVRQLKADYDQWWKTVAEHVNEFRLIPVGSEAENPVLLSACDWQDVFLDQTLQVRRGLRRNGSINLLVEQAGTYEFSLRRWPEESGLAITAPAPEYKAADGVIPAGISLPIQRAHLTLGQHSEYCEVAPNDKVVVFRLELPAGPTSIRTHFDDARGTEIAGAYYVTVRRLDSNSSAAPPEKG